MTAGPGPDMITSGRPQISASTVPAHNVMSDAPAFRQAALASSSSAGWALTGPGGSINFAAGTDVTDVDAGEFPGSGAEVPPLAVIDDPEVHPAKTKDTTTRAAPVRKERDVFNPAASSADFPPY
jgi:hypothetical protein